MVRLAKFTVLRCLLVVVTTPDLESAYRIFSVLNDRGLDLSLTDILKAEILGAIPDELQEEYASKWENIEDALGREKFENLFTYIRTIRRKVKTKETILKEIRQYVRPTENPREFIDRTLEECADVLMIITKSNYESTELAEEINSQLGLLNKIDNADWIPPAVDYFLRNKGATSTLLLFLTALEKLASGMMVYRANVNERIDRYAQILGWIQEEGKDILSTGSPLWLSREEKQKMYDTLNGDLYNNKPICSFVLQRLNSALPLEAGMAQSEKYPVISVEHVLPQNPKKGSEWERWFPTEEIRAHYTNRLGNLILLSRRKNSMAQNYEFSKKKERYFKIRGVSPFALTTTVINYNEWTPAIIENQQKFLLETRMGTWKY